MTACPCDYSYTARAAMNSAKYSSHRNTNLMQCNLPDFGLWSMANTLMISSLLRTMTSGGLGVEFLPFTGSPRPQHTLLITHRPSVTNPLCPAPRYDRCTKTQPCPRLALSNYLRPSAAYNASLKACRQDPFSYLKGLWLRTRRQFQSRLCGKLPSSTLSWFQGWLLCRETVLVAGSAKHQPPRTYTHLKLLYDR